MPVDFLGDAEVAAYGRFVGVPSVEELERFCFLDDVDRALIDRRREDHARLGFAVQLTTVRAVGAFLADPAEVPSVVVDYLAGQLGISDGSCLAAYSTRRTTRFEHAEQIRRSYSLVSFGEVAKELEVWIDARAWTTGDGPTALFVGSVGWLRDRRVVLPGLTTLTRLVARVREEALERLWDRLCDVLTVEQRTELDDTLTVGDGTRVSALERWRRGPVAASGRGLERALRRVAEIDRVGLVGADFVVVVPHRRLVEVARYGMSASASHLRRHLPLRRLATLAATVVELKGRAIDDCLELFDLVMVTELLGKAERVAENEKLRRHASLVRASTVLASAVGVLLDPVWGPDAQLAVVLVHDRRDRGPVRVTRCARDRCRARAGDRDRRGC